MNNKKQSKKDCPPAKIYNPISKRCILKTSKKGKELLLNNSNSNCDEIKIKWENNSCYLDSLLVAFFNRKDKVIEKLLLKAPVNDYGNQELKTTGEKIQKELTRIYMIISNQTESDSKSNCSSLRKLLAKYYSQLIKIDSRKKIVDNYDTWTITQLDIYDLYRLLQLIFKIKDDILKIQDGSNLINSNFSNEVPIDFLINASKKVSKVLKISSIYPKYKLKYNLTKENKYRDASGKLKSYYYKETEILKGEKLFINIYRNIGAVKSDVKIEPCKTLKLKENDFDLYLTSIIIHYGKSPNSGHYICLYKCYKDDNWYEFDDLIGTTKIGDLKTVIKNKDYLANIVGLIYSKLD